MRLLILGGTWFLGRALGEVAIGRGWSVTTFNRGESAPDLSAVEAVHGNRERPEDLKRLATHGPWDAVVDTIGFVPEQVLSAATALEPVAGRYVYVSSVNVYTGWPDLPLRESSPLFDCPPDAAEDYAVELGYAGQYGTLKAGCERAVEQTFGPTRSVLLRPGVIVGPREYVGRLTWWLNRSARGGEMLAPAPAARPIQPVDVRDVAEFAAHCATSDLPGAFNITAPQSHATFGELVDTCAQLTSAGAHAVWAEPEWLVANGVQQWTELPLWRTPGGVWEVDNSRASAAGLRCRPLRDTIADTWSWMTGGASAITGEGEAGRAADHGISSDREAELLSAWHRR